jgi:hypothetical protein
MNLLKPSVVDDRLGVIDGGGRYSALLPVLR